MASLRNFSPHLRSILLAEKAICFELVTRSTHGGTTWDQKRKSFLCFQKSFIPNVCKGSKRSPISSEGTHSRRYLNSQGTIIPVITDGQNQNKKLWQINLSQPFGKVVAKTKVPLKIGQVNVLEYPTGDKAFVSVLSENGKPMWDSDFLNGSIKYNSDTGEILFVTGDVPASDLSWMLDVLPIFDIDVHHESSNPITVENLENNRTRIKSQKGDIILKKMKSWQVSLQSEKGGIEINKFLQGNARIYTGGKKGISTARLQGQDFVLETKEGPIICKDIYCQTADISSEEGDMQLGNCHGSYKISTSGNVVIGSLDGCLDLSVSGNGSVTVFLAKPQNVSISTYQGDVMLNIAADLNDTVEFSSPCVNIPSGFVLDKEESEGRQVVKGQLNKSSSRTDGRIKVHSERGTITMKTQSWLETLNLEG